MKFFLQFLRVESASATVLLIFTLLALLIANSSINTLYQAILHYSYHDISLYHGINEGLMTLFFLLVSLEIKRELLLGELNDATKSLLPIIAALAGMVMPALLYLSINYQHHANLPGWAIPCATDIAFSLAILNFLGSRIPIALRLFVTALAIIDDLGSILIIALFYTQTIHLLFLILAGLCTIVLVILNKYRITHVSPYILLSILLWLCILKSGIHATVAGVILAFILPLSTTLEKKLHPWVAFIILPLFAFSNAGLSLQHLTWSNVWQPLPLGIILGLFLGKQFGIFTAIWLSNKFGIVALPATINWQHIYGASILCGIGFTMSLFIGSLAFAQNTQLLELIKLGVFLGSLLSALWGYIVLKNN